MGARKDPARIQRDLERKAGQRKGNPTKTNAAINRQAKLFKYGGNAIVVASAIVSASRIYNSEPCERGKVASEEAGSWIGSMAGGSAAVWATSVVASGVLGAETGTVGGPIGAAVGFGVGIVGGAVGGAMGSQVGGSLYDWVFDSEYETTEWNQAY